MLAKYEEHDRKRLSTIDQCMCTQQCLSQSATRPRDGHPSDFGGLTFNRSQGGFRSILVTEYIKLFDHPSFCAGTPLPETLKYLLTHLSCNEHNVMGHVDVSRAYFHAAARRTLYVRDQEPGGDARCGKLKQTMHGTMLAVRVSASAGITWVSTWKKLILHILPCVEFGEDFTIVAPTSSVVYIQT